MELDEELTTRLVVGPLGRRKGRECKKVAAIELNENISIFGCC